MNQISEAAPVRDIIYLSTPKFASRDAILRDVCERYGVQLADVKGKSRVPRFVLPRHEACYRLKYEAGLSYGRIGQILGGRDHSTIIHGAKKHAQRNGLEAT